MDYTPKREDRLVREATSIVFRGEEYRYVHSHYVEPNGECYTTTSLDEANFNQVYNQYRERYGIPYPDEIRDMLDKYGVSASKMGAILGFGENSIGNYLDGEVPNKANGKVLAAIRKLTVFETYVDNAREQIGEKAYLKIKGRIADLEGKEPDITSFIIFPKAERSIYNGFAAQSTKKVKDVILCALSRLGDTYKTKMNKILFYIDMLSYRQRGFAITGLAYKAEQYGTIPYRSEQIYSLLGIPRSTYYDGDREYSPLHADGDAVLGSITEDERKVIEYVCDRFRDYTAARISEENHKEQAWQKYKDTNKPIPFTEAFCLTQI